MPDTRPTTPATEATCGYICGKDKAWHERWPDDIDHDFEAASPAALDVERLNLAAYRTPEKRGESRKEWLIRVAAEYARLTTTDARPAVNVQSPSENEHLMPLDNVTLTADNKIIVSGYTLPAWVAVTIARRAEAASPTALDVERLTDALSFLGDTDVLADGSVWAVDEIAAKAAAEYARLSRSAEEQGPPHEDCSCVNCEGTPFDPPPWKHRLSRSAGEQGQ